MDSDCDILLLDGTMVRNLLEDSEDQVIDIIYRAYSVYGQGDCSLPNSTFLRFKHDAVNRIIGLPAYLGGEFNLAGIKWVSSFPGNINNGLDRASATLTLNDCQTGRPIAFMEASSINAHRTAASAAVAARQLFSGSRPRTCALVGCGYIGFELVNYIRRVFPSIDTIFIVDKVEARAKHFFAKARAKGNRSNIIILTNVEELSCCRCDFILFATSASEPWLVNGDIFSPGSIILNISLRDIAPSVLLRCNNVVDDVEHICRENTSIHLAVQEVGNSNFIDAELPNLISGIDNYSPDPEKVTIFSPFGLGILDLALGKWVVGRAKELNCGRSITNFFPAVWDAVGVT